MIPLTQFKNQHVAVLGGGLTGQSLAQAVRAGGGHVTLYDDKPCATQNILAPQIDLPNSPLIEGWQAQPDGVLSDLAIDKHPAPSGHPSGRGEFYAVAGDHLDITNIFAPQTGLAIDALLLSPGIPLTHAMVRDAQARNIAVLNDCEAFYCALTDAAPIKPCFITITGTNGKSTTTALIGHLLRASGHAPAVGGNIGVPVLHLPLPTHMAPAPLCTRVPYVIEMSSYQAEGTTCFTPNIAVFLNLTPDHLERHGTMQQYYACKTAPMRRMNNAHTAIVAIDDAYGQKLAQELTTQGVCVKTISAYGHAADYTTQNGLIYEHGAFIANMQHHEHLQGQHNLQNTLAAVAAARAFGGSVTDIARALPAFVGLPHRLQPAGTWKHIRFVNDSKATNAESSVHALRACRNIYWILGGLAKAGGLQSLTTKDIEHVNRAYLIGAASDVFAEQLTTLGIRYQQCHTLDNALKQAARDAQHDSAQAVVLLSPACASQDQFKDYQQRGTHFMELVQAWQKTPPTLC